MQSFEKILRVHKLALEDRLKKKLPVKHPIFAWLVEFCADLYNKHQIGRDGTSAMQRLKGKRCVQPSAEFCAAVMFRVVGKVQGGEMRERWHSGIFLGKKAGSEENLVMKSDGGVVRARAIREVHRTVSLAELDQLQGTPHDPAGTLRGGGRDEGRPGALEEAELGDGDLGPVPKRVQITKDVVNRFGGTPGCLKCRGVMAGDKSFQFVHHSDACRVRMESLMREDEKFSKLIQAAEDRQTRRIAELLERRDQDAASQQHEPRDQQRKRPAVDKHDQSSRTEPRRGGCHIEHRTEESRRETPSRGTDRPEGGGWRGRP